MICYPHIMTNEIAFELGRFNFPCFYDIVIWSPNVKDFEYANFFRWKSGMGLYCKIEDDYKHTFCGYLDEEKFKTLEHKLKYIQGRLSSYSVKLQDNYIHIGYANSYESRNRVVKWAHEILKKKFGGLKTWEIKTGEHGLTTPGTPYLEIFGDSELIAFIKEGSFD